MMPDKNVPTQAGIRFLTARVVLGALFLLVLCGIVSGCTRAVIEHLWTAPPGCPCGPSCPCCPGDKPTGYGRALPKDARLETAVVSDGGAEFRWRDRGGARYVCRLSAEESARRAALSEGGGP